MVEIIKHLKFMLKWFWKLILGLVLVCSHDLRPWHMPDILKKGFLLLQKGCIALKHLKPCFLSTLILIQYLEVLFEFLAHTKKMYLKTSIEPKYGAFNLNNKVTMHGLVLLVQLSLKVAWHHTVLFLNIIINCVSSAENLKCCMYSNYIW